MTRHGKRDLMEREDELCNVGSAYVILMHSYVVCRGNAQAVPIHRAVLTHAGVLKSCQNLSLGQQLEHLYTMTVGSSFVIVSYFFSKQSWSLSRKGFHIGLSFGFRGEDACRKRTVST